LDWRRRGRGWMKTVLSIGAMDFHPTPHWHPPPPNIVLLAVPKGSIPKLVRFLY